MLQTNLIGRSFSSKMDKSVLTCVACYVTGGNFYMVGESERGSLVTLAADEVSLIKFPRVADENLNGVI